MILYRLFGKLPWSICESLFYNTCITELFVKQLEPRSYIDAKKRVKPLPSFHTNMKHAKPSETLPWLHDQLVKYIRIAQKILKLL
jgi:hypothetical protein